MTRAQTKRTVRGTSLRCCGRCTRDPVVCCGKGLLRQRESRFLGEVWGDGHRVVLAAVGFCQKPFCQLGSTVLSQVLRGLSPDTDSRYSADAAVPLSYTGEDGSGVIAVQRGQKPRRTDLFEHLNSRFRRFQDRRIE